MSLTDADALGEGDARELDIKVRADRIALAPLLLSLRAATSGGGGVGLGAVPRLLGVPSWIQGPARSRTAAAAADQIR